MIVTPEGSTESSNAKMRTVDSEGIDDQPPPSYTSQVDPSGSREGDPSSPPSFKSKPTNHLVLANARNSLKGEFVIDPSIQLPSSFLPPLRDGETEADRKNLCLNSRYGSIQADIWLLPGGSPNDTVLRLQKPRVRTTIDLTSDNGSIHAQLQRLDGAAPFMMTACAPHGSVNITLPRSFKGLLSLSTRHGSICLADKVMLDCTQLGQVDDTRRYFVGPGDFHSFGDGEWNGDEVVITTIHGHIRVKYPDEASDDHSKGGFFGWFKFKR